MRPYPCLSHAFNNFIPEKLRFHNRHTHIRHLIHEVNIGIAVLICMSNLQLRCKIIPMSMKVIFCSSSKWWSRNIICDNQRFPNPSRLLNSCEVPNMLLNNVRTDQPSVRGSWRYHGRYGCQTCIESRGLHRGYAA
jgi:hypothetical protein